VTPEAVAAEATEIQLLSEPLTVPLRLIGSLAIAERCPRHRHLMAELGRRPPRDIDFIAYARDEHAIHQLLTHRGYVLHPSVSHSREWGVNRLIYTHPENGAKVDIFLDKLVMAHTIDFADCLEREPKTVSLADLLLSKLQIYRITANDLIDLTVLLAEVDVGVAPDQIAVERVKSVLGDDWGFTYGAKLNLARLIEEVQAGGTLDHELAARVEARAKRLIEEIDATPKSRRWRMRARLGTRVAWYEHVDDVDV
jgi:hypothetical protein